MDYFFSHIGYIILAAVAIAAIGFALVYFGEKNSDGEGFKGGCGMGCSGCASAASCGIPEKDIKRIEASIANDKGSGRG